MNEVLDYAQHVVRINQLVQKLNEQVRQTYKPDLDELEITLLRINNEAHVCLRMIDWERQDSDNPLFAGNR